MGPSTWFIVRRFAGRAELCSEEYGTRDEAQAMYDRLMTNRSSDERFSIVEVIYG